MSRTLFIPAFLAASMLSAQMTAFTHATLIDGSGRPPLTDTTLVVDSGRIRDIGPAAKLKPPAGAQIVDATGLTIIPGIINLHAHIDANTPVKLRQFALYGVTTVVGMGGDGDDVLAIRNAQRKGDIKGARVFTVLQRFEFEKDARRPPPPVPVSMRSREKAPTRSNWSSTTATIRRSNSRRRFSSQSSIRLIRTT